MPQIIVLPRDEAQHFQYDGPWAAISIATYPKEFIQLRTENRVALLQLAFMDIDRPLSPTSKHANDPDTKFFDQEQAQKIINFAKSVWDKIDVLLVHCEAGVSRSPAVAAALSVIFNGPRSDNTYFKQYIPNRHVYKTILNTHSGDNSQTSESPEPDEKEKEGWMDFFDRMP
jgi:predicted protein tyrosine phosphatase